MAENIVKPTVNTAAPAATPTPAPVQAPTVVVIKTEESPKATVPEPTQAEQKVAGDHMIPSDPYYTDPLFYEVANYFDVKQEEYAGAKYKLSDIVDYVIREGKSNKPEDVLRGLRKLEDTVQPPGWGEKRYTNVHKYIRLAARKQSISQAMSAFERKGAFDYGN